MYVIRVTNTTAATVTIAAGIQIAANGGHKLFPADRCVWDSNTSSDGGYRIGAAEFIIANGDAVALNSGSDHILELGYIGKSGRFVPITN